MNKINRTAELEKGDIVLWWSKVFLGYVQLAFTKRGKRYYDPQPRSGKKSHTSVIYSVAKNRNVALDVDVTTKVKLNEMQIETVSAKWIYRLIDVPQEEINTVVDDLWSKYGGQSYPWWQWQTYPSRWLFEILQANPYWTLPLQPIRFLWHAGHGFKDVRSWGTVFPQGGVCSEIAIWDFLANGICPKRIKKGDMRFKQLLDRLNEWSANKFHSTDSEVVLTDFEGTIFDHIYYKPYTNKNLLEK